MTDEGTEQRDQESAEFAAESKKPAPPIWKEFLEFLVHQPSWWLIPLVVVLLLLGLAAILVPAEALPFIYTLW